MPVDRLVGDELGLDGLDRRAVLAEPLPGLRPATGVDVLVRQDPIEVVDLAVERRPTGRLDGGPQHPPVERRGELPDARLAPPSRELLVDGAESPVCCHAADLAVARRRGPGLELDHCRHHGTHDL